MRVLLLVLVINFIGFCKPIDEKCSTDEDCANEKAVCINNKCQCDSLSKFSKTVGKCLKYATEYNSLCYEESQCNEFLGSNTVCKNNVCLCDEGYSWYQGECKKYLQKDEKCSSGEFCLDLNDPLALTCQNGKCTCSKGYYDRGPDCRVKSEVNQECAINNDCFPTGTQKSHCELGKCVKDTNTKSLIAQYNYEQFYDDMLGNVVITDSDSTCKNVLQNLTKDDCNKCLNTHYFQDTACICNPGFFLQDGQCIAELGMTDPNKNYTIDKDCPIKPGKAKDGICYCKDYWFQSYTNRECKKTTLQYTQSCMDNDWCKAMGPYSYCDSKTQKCNCISQAILNETSFVCELNSDANMTGICLQDTECPLYEQCLDEKCQCVDGFYKFVENGLCLPEIGSSCEFLNCSHIENATCSSDEICQCSNDNFVTNGYGCFEVSTHLDQECSISEQCKNIPNADCLNGTSGKGVRYCLCIDEYVDVSGTCYANKEYGSQCSTKLDCTIILGDTFVCRNNLCQCSVDYKLKNNICVSSSADKLLLSQALTLLLSGFLVMRGAVRF